MAKSTGTCAHCGNATSQHCSRCFEGLDVDGKPMPTVYYCGKDCQQAGFEEHKDESRHARDRKQFYRGAEILSSLYYAFRESTFDYPFRDFEIQEGKAYITYGRWVAGVLYPYPRGLVAEPALKKAVLSYNNCCEAQLYLEDFVSALFAGIKPKVVFKVTKIKMDPVHKKVFHYVDGTREVDQNNKDHVMMKATLSDGNEYAVDLAGAQYGQLRPAMPLSTYERDYADELNAVWKMVFNKAAVINLDGVAQVSPIGRFVIKHLSAKTAEWEKDHKMSVAALLNKKQPMFGTRKDDLVRKLSNEIAEHVKVLLYNGLACTGADY